MSHASDNLKIYIFILLSKLKFKSTFDFIGVGFIEKNLISTLYFCIKYFLFVIQDKIAMVNDTVEGNFEPVCPPRFLHNGLELNFKVYSFEIRF